jgi:acetyl-CoA carboxylase biotin carboxyl carrier protein
MASPDPKDIESLVELFNESDWDEMHLKTDELEVFLSNDPHATGLTNAVAVGGALVSPTVVASERQTFDAPAPVAASQAPSAATISDGMVGVNAPNLGTFYRAPKPGALDYVEIGQHVEADTEVCLIEVMKLFTPVRAGTAGIVREICVDDGQMVEFGQLLAVIEPQD